VPVDHRLPLATQGVIEGLGGEKGLPSRSRPPRSELETVWGEAVEAEDPRQGPLQGGNLRQEGGLEDGEALSSLVADPIRTERQHPRLPQGVHLALEGGLDLRGPGPRSGGLQQGGDGGLPVEDALAPDLVGWAVITAVSTVVQNRRASGRQDHQGQLFSGLGRSGIPAAAGGRRDVGQLGKDGKAAISSSMSARDSP